MEVVTIERTQLGILQRKHVAPGGNDDIVSRLRRMGENAGKAVELALAELDRVAAGVEALYDVLAEIRGKRESVVMAAANEDVIA